MEVRPLEARLPELGEGLLMEREVREGYGANES